MPNGLDIPNAPVDYASSDEFFVEHGRAPVVAPGDYAAIYTHFEMKEIFKTVKIFAWFKIVDPGPYYGVSIYRAFRVVRSSKRRFKVGRRSELCIALCRLFEQKIRPDRISLSWLKGCILRISVRMVTRDYMQRAIPLALQYSVVDDILEIETGI